MQEEKEVLEIALSIIKGINGEFVKRFPEVGITVSDFFSLSKRELISIFDIREPGFLDTLKREEAIFEARKEWSQIKKHNIKVLFILNEYFPVRLFQIPDPPIVLYQLGEADLDSEQIISLVGTRRPTPYGIEFCNKFITDLSVYFPDMPVVSGLAHGIDSVSHKAAISKKMPTVAVVAHGLNMIYPAQNRGLAKDILNTGGAIVSEYRFGEMPYRQRFLERNRIIAALSDVTIVVESAVKGGAMSTANTAFSYSREVMAVPGKIYDESSSGCNLLIRKGKASLITSAADLIETTGWKPMGLEIDVTKRNLFPELEGNAKIVYDILRFANEPMQTDRLHQLSLIPMKVLVSLLGEMEFDGIINKYPGNRYAVS